MLCFNVIYLQAISCLIDKVVCEVKQKNNKRTKETKYFLSTEKSYCVKNILKTTLHVKGKPLQRMQLSASLYVFFLALNQPYLIFNDAKNSRNLASCFVLFM